MGASKSTPPCYTSESRRPGVSRSHHGCVHPAIRQSRARSARQVVTTRAHWTVHWATSGRDIGRITCRMAWGLVAVRFRLRYPRGTRIGLLGADWKLGAMAPHILGSAQARGSADIRRVMLTPAMMADRGCGRRARSVGNSRRGGTSCGGAYKILASFSFHKGWQGPTEAQLMGR
ncbi:hypothetical protein PCASD_02031 [Puccinia coronata f. sp. avenae]|uniref:Uncharacterized protein n=1 Tax=Puccinia coronata f. sp. avenae TaxID=200324 RepID=A0A2N5VQ40_9BASI|nr:hypothetical protein PCASD_02031 [Puccinia coronata f. sp. avenae]